MSPHSLLGLDFNGESTKTITVKGKNLTGALSFAVNTYLNHILQQVHQEYKVDDSWDVPSNEKFNSLG